MNKRSAQNAGLESPRNSKKVNTKKCSYFVSSALSKKHVLSLLRSVRDSLDLFEDCASFLITTKESFENFFTPEREEKIYILFEYATPEPVYTPADVQTVESKALELLTPLFSAYSDENYYLRSEKVKEFDRLVKILTQESFPAIHRNMDPDNFNMQYIAKAAAHKYELNRQHCIKNGLPENKVPDENDNFFAKWGLNFSKSLFKTFQNELAEIYNSNPLYKLRSIPFEHLADDDYRKLVISSVNKWAEHPFDLQPEIELKEYKHILIIGEADSGKTHLVNKMLFPYLPSACIFRPNSESKGFAYEQFNTRLHRAVIIDECPDLRSSHFNLSKLKEFAGNGEFVVNCKNKQAKTGLKVQVPIVIMQNTPSDDYDFDSTQLAGIQERFVIVRAESNEYIEREKAEYRAKREKERADRKAELERSCRASTSTTTVAATVNVNDDDYDQHEYEFDLLNSKFGSCLSNTPITRHQADRELRRIEAAHDRIISEENMLNQLRQLHRQEEDRLLSRMRQIEEAEKRLAEAKASTSSTASTNTSMADATTDEIVICSTTTTTIVADSQANTTTTAPATTIRDDENIRVADTTNAVDNEIVNCSITTTTATVADSGANATSTQYDEQETLIAVANCVEDLVNCVANTTTTTAPAITILADENIRVADNTTNAVDNEIANCSTTTTVADSGANATSTIFDEQETMIAVANCVEDLVSRVANTVDVESLAGAALVFSSTPLATTTTTTKAYDSQVSTTSSQFDEQAMIVVANLVEQGSKHTPTTTAAMNVVARYTTKASGYWSNGLILSSDEDDFDDYSTICQRKKKRSSTTSTTTKPYYCTIDENSTCTTTTYSEAEYIDLNLSQSDIESLYCIPEDLLSD